MRLKLTSLFLSIVVVALSAFKNPAPKTITYKVDLEKSALTWTGKKLTGSHSGSINLKSGTLAFSGKKLIEGGFIIDMNSIKDADKSEGLEKHLKADDFFGTDKFPTSSFVIKKITNTNANTVNITGNLTIKGVSNSITFPATVAWAADGSVIANADKITIDRTKWGIKYKSKSVFTDLGDKFIYDDFELSVKLVAKK